MPLWLPECYKKRKSNLARVAFESALYELGFCAMRVGQEENVAGWATTPHSVALVAVLQNVGEFTLLHNTQAGR